MVNRPRRILFLYIYESSFVNADLATLRKHYDVRAISFGSIKRNKLKLPRLLWDLFVGVIWCDLTLSWFADIHAYAGLRLSRLFRRKSIVIIGGYEVAKVPEIRYGRLYTPRMEKRISYILRNSDRILMVDDSLRIEAMANLGITDRVFSIVPTGHDPETFKPAGKKTNRVLTVGYLGCRGSDGPKRKGLDVFVETARLMPDLEFMMIGVTSEDLLTDSLGPLPPNLKVLKPIQHDQLVQYYQGSKVYCQLSLHEGLPSSLCESMLCECVPVGTSKCGIVTAIGDAGFLVGSPDPKEVAGAISKALTSDLGGKARQRIIDHFSTEIRERNLVSVIEGLLSLEK